MTLAQVAEAVETDASNLHRIESGHHAPKADLARKLYTFYRGDVAIIDIYDPTFLDEVGLIETTTRGFRVVTRHGVESVTGLENLRGTLHKFGVLKPWEKSLA